MTTVSVTIAWSGDERKTQVTAWHRCIGAPFCMPFTIVDDITFTVTASYDAADGDTFTQDFLLSNLV